MFVTESMVADGRIIDNQCLVVELLQKFEIDVNEYKLGSNKVSDLFNFRENPNFKKRILGHKFQLFFSFKDANVQM